MHCGLGLALELLSSPSPPRPRWPRRTTSASRPWRPRALWTGSCSASRAPPSCRAACLLRGGVSWPGSTVNVTGGGDSAFLRRGASASAAAAPRERTTTFSNYRRFAESLSSRLHVTLRRLGFVLAIFWRYVNLYVCMHVWRLQCLRCFDAVGWAAGRASGL